MTFVLYLSSIVLVRSLGQIDTDEDEDPNGTFLAAKFGSIGQSMLTLFELMVNPYLQPYHGVLAEQPILTFFIIAFIIFGSFGMIALLTGVIHENMFEKNQLRMEEERQEREAKRKSLVKVCGNLFDEVAEEHGGSVPKHRFDDLKLLLPRVADLFKLNGVHLVEDDLHDIIDLMDA